MKCEAPNQTPKVIILPKSIRRNWLIIKDLHVGDSIISINSNTYPNGNKRIVISTWENKQKEIHDIKDIISDPQGNIFVIIAENIRRSYSKHSILFENDIAKLIVRALTLESCAFIGHNANLHDIVHEFLHMKNVGPLSHTKTNDHRNTIYYV